jgi:hypothetical protein
VADEISKGPVAEEVVQSRRAVAGVAEEAMANAAWVAVVYAVPVELVYTSKRTLPKVTKELLMLTVNA